MAGSSVSSGVSTSSGSSRSTNNTDSSSSSSSGSYVPNYEQTPILMAIAQYSQQLAQNAAEWGVAQFNSNQELTDETVNNYLDSSRTSRDLAGNQLDRYQNLFQPQENALIRDANTFSSAGRIQQDVGAAEAAAGQAADAGRKNAIRDLQSYGIDPSSGRYAALDSAERANEAAMKVGAGQRARQNTENVGRGLRQQAIQVGQQYPGQAIGAIRAGYEGLSGAQGAAMANTDRGIALQNAPNAYLQTGMSLKYPPLGNTASSSSTSTGRGVSTSQNQSQGNQNSSSSQTDPAQRPQQQGGGGGGSRGGGGGGGGDDVYGGMDNTAPGGYVSRNTGGGGGGGADAAVYSVPDDYSGAGGATYDDGTRTGDTIGNDYGGYGSEYDYYGGGGGSDYSYEPGPQAGTGYDSAYDSYGEYEAGGDVMGPEATRGGFVSAEMSPSGGDETDDVDAKLNTHEFVIPKDVTLWKGQEFFQKLIASAREARVTGTVAKPKQGPAR